jgi:sugar/nucleoside kinase (ribokinase family)
LIAAVPLAAAWGPSTLRDCLAFAGRASAITCTRRGAALPARRELPALA